MSGASMTDVERWDAWFAAAEDAESTRTWEAAKRIFSEPRVLVGWAALIEINRLDRLAKQAPPRGDVPRGGA